MAIKFVIIFVIGLRMQDANIVMNPRAYMRLYAIIAPFCLIFSLSAYLLMQGAAALTALAGLDATGQSSARISQSWRPAYYYA